MELRYFVVDAGGRLHKAPRAAVRRLWAGRRGAANWACAGGQELRLVSVACDPRLLPRRVYLLRLPLTEGTFTEADYLTLQAFTRPDCVTYQELARHHTDGWPADFFRQLAVALDVPVAALDVPFAVGGPLFLAAAMKVTPERAARYLR